MAAEVCIQESDRGVAHISVVRNADLADEDTSAFYVPCMDLVKGVYYGEPCLEVVDYS